MGFSEPDANRRRLVVGLGNPGSRYAATRHNVGFRVVDELARRWSADGPKEDFQARVWDARPARRGEAARVLLMQPLTFMNRSGQACRKAVDFYKVDAADVLVVMDDMALPTAALRARAGGSAGGQKGLADVLTTMGTQQIPRLRIGIGQPPPGWDGADYVLSTFRDDETEDIGAAIGQAADAVEDWVFHGLTYVMDRYNRMGDRD